MHIFQSLVIEFLLLKISQINFWLLREGISNISNFPIDISNTFMQINLKIHHQYFSTNYLESSWKFSPKMKFFTSLSSNLVCNFASVYEFNENYSSKKKSQLHFICKDFWMSWREVVRLMTNIHKKDGT